MRDIYIEEVNMSELHKRNQSYIEFDLSDAQVAAKILENHFHITDFTAAGNTVKFYNFSNNIGEINLEFALNGMLITRINNGGENLEGHHLLVAIKWLLKFMFGSIFMFLTVTPFAYIAQRTKGFVAPVIASSVIVMGSVAVSNQDLGSLYPWTATYFLVQGKIPSAGYPVLLSVAIILLVSAVGFFMTLHHFKKEDLK